MPRILGRLWRNGARRVEITDPGPAEAEEAAGIGEADPPLHETETDPGELGRRLEAARARLREAIPPPDADAGDR